MVHCYKPFNLHFLSIERAWFALSVVNVDVMQIWTGPKSRCRHLSFKRFSKKVLWQIVSSYLSKSKFRCGLQRPVWVEWISRGRWLVSESDAVTRKPEEHWAQVPRHLKTKQTRWPFVTGTDLATQIAWNWLARGVLGQQSSPSRKSSQTIFKLKITKNVQNHDIWPIQDSTSVAIVTVLFIAFMDRNSRCSQGAVGLSFSSLRILTAYCKCYF